MLCCWKSLESFSIIIRFILIKLELHVFSVGGLFVCNVTAIAESKLIKCFIKCIFMCDACLLLYCCKFFHAKYPSLILNYKGHKNYLYHISFFEGLKCLCHSLCVYKIGFLQDSIQFNASIKPCWYVKRRNLKAQL
jgi:hypothetical protein